MDENTIMLNREIGLYYCLGASKDLAAICGGLDKISDYLQGDSALVVDRVSKVIMVLNKWWCRMAACNGDKVEPVTQDELDLYMDPSDTPIYTEAISRAIEEGTKRAVKIKEIPIKTKNGQSGRNQ